MSSYGLNMGRDVLSSLVVFFLLQAAPCRAQNLREVGHFWAMNGTVKLLPTGIVLKREEGKTTLYSFQRGRYVADKRVQVPEPLMNWTYFDWESIDWDDQLSRNKSDIPEGKFWPQNAKVKKLVYLSPRNAPVVLVVVCYTVPEPPEDFPSEHSKFIRLVALKGNWTDSGHVYHELWTKTLEKESSYGELTVQDAPGIGRMLVLYSASAGASSESEQLDLYVLQNTD